MARFAAVVALAALILPAAAFCGEPGAGIVGLLGPGTRAAPALGGDPFLSPLGDEAGWWSRLSAGVERTLAVAIDEAEPVSRRASRDRGLLRCGAVSWEGAYAASRAGWRWSAAGRLERRRWRGSWSGIEGGAAIGGGGTEIDLACRAENPRRALTLQSSVPLGGGPGRLQRAPLGFGVRYRPGSKIAAQAHWERRSRPELFESGLYDQVWSASLNLRCDAVRVDGRIVFPRGIRWDGSAQRNWYRGNGEAPAPRRYGLEPQGESRSNQMSLTYSRSSLGTFLVRRSAMQAGIEGSATYGGERFGRLTYARCRLESYLAAFQPVSSARGRAFIEAEAVRLEGEARATLETWPFTPTLLDLLGHRRIFEASGRASWTRWHAASEMRFGGRWTVGAGACWYDIRPRLAIDSWRPAFLVFGRADERRDELAVHRVRLAVLSLGATYGAGGRELRAAVEQVVFARGDKSRPQGPDGDAGGPAPVPGSAPRGAPGGTRVRASLTQRF